MNNPETGHQVEVQQPPTGGVLERLRGTRAGNVVALGLTGIALGIGANAVQGTVSPDRAEASDPACTVQIKDNKKIEDCVYEDGSSTHTETSVDSPQQEGQPADPSKPKEEANKPGANKDKKRAEVREKRRKQKIRERREARREQALIRSVLKRDQPTGNTCFATGFGMIAASLNLDKSITTMEVARSSQLRPYFTVDGGVKRGAYLPKSIPALSRRYGLKTSPERENFNEAKRTIKKGGMSLVLFQGGHFASPAGHFTVLYDYKNGKFRMADPNKQGRSGDSEKRWWPATTLKKFGAIGVWNFTKKRK